MQQHIIQKKTYAEHKLNEEKVVVKKHVQLPPPQTIIIVTSLWIICVSNEIVYLVVKHIYIL